MKKWILRAGIALWLMCSVFTFGHMWNEPNLPKLYRQTSSAVVKIKVDSNYDEWEGTGIFIEDDLILTAGHIVDNANEVWIIWSDGKKHKAVDWYKETEADLGIVYIRTPEREKRLRFDNAVIGEEAWTCGNSLGYGWVLSKGVVSVSNIDFEDNFFGNKNVFFIDTATNPGNSGGPIFNKNGEILGILVGGFYNTQGMNIVIPAKICQLTLDKYYSIKALQNAE